MFLNHKLKFLCDMVWSSEAMFVWYLWLIILLFSLFPITEQLFFYLKYINLIPKDKG